MASGIPPGRISTEIRLLTNAGQCDYSTDYIRELLLTDSNKAGHGKEFKGRPVTNIISDEQNVVKLRTEYQLDYASSLKFIDAALKRENTLSIYHPKKCWFLVGQDDDAPCLIGNISPKLFPLNHYLTHPERQTEKCEIICQVVELYMLVAKQHQFSLDLDLSNFAIAPDGKIFYLDDEVYRWLDFNPVIDFIAHLFRTGVIEEKNTARELAVLLRNQVVKFYRDLHYLTVISESLKSSYMSATQRNYLDIFRREFNQDPGYSVYQHVNSASKIALIADIHANMPALEAVLTFLASSDIEQILLLGDMVGYGPHPNECIDILSKLDNLLVIRGNHDHAAISGVETGGVTSLANWSRDWTRARLTKQAKQWLMKTPPYLQGENWLAVHGAPIDKTFFNAYVYQMSYVENLDVLKQRDIRLCFHGHTHIQKVYYRTHFQDGMSSENHQSLEDYHYSLICPGSVGQPRNKQTGAEFAFIDLACDEINFHKIDYDIETTIHDMQRLAFPQKMIDRLSHGE